MKKIIFANFIKNNFLILSILTVAFIFRTYSINWDDNFYFHPDERAIVMFTTSIHLPSSISDFFSPDSPLNPNFFAYGNFPIYLLKIVSEAASYFNPILNDYGGMHLVGRPISAIFDTLTVLLVYLIGKNLFSKKAGLWASLIYALTVFPIQLSHFFAVDTLLTFFLILSLFLSILFFKKPNLKHIVFIGISFGFALSTKFSALIFIIVVIFLLTLIFFYQKVSLPKLFKFLFIFSLTAFAVFTVTQPYAIIDFIDFYTQTKQQTQMSSDPFVFPYTLQYVGKVPYFYEIKNIFFWGAGPIITSLAIIGILFSFQKILANKKNNIPLLILLFYITIYFLMFGRFSVGWMRYMLPIYPILSVLAGFFTNILHESIPKKSSNLKNIFIAFFIAILLIYPLSFINIYKSENTRIQASNWIHNNIPAESNIAIEHWDDALPVFGGEKYNQIILPLYDADTKNKWNQIESSLEKADYIILASNRLYIPLQKLTDCKNLPPGKCYSKTSQYYENLFAEKMGFKKVAEFKNYPKIPLLNTEIIDDNADESFTVYDHPKVMIFKRTNIDLEEFSN